MKPKDKPLQRERKEAKRLLRDYTNRDGLVLPDEQKAARNRVEKVYRNSSPEDFTLMNAQHVIAAERGFKSRGAMLEQKGVRCESDR